MQKEEEMVQSEHWREKKETDELMKSSDGWEDDEWTGLIMEEETMTKWLKWDP